MRILYPWCWAVYRECFFWWYEWECDAGLQMGLKI